MWLIILYILCGIGAGLGTGLSGMSAAVVIAPMLITFAGISPYQAIGIALASDVLASAISAYTYGKKKNIDIKNALTLMIPILTFTILGSIFSEHASDSIGVISLYMTLILGLKFLIKPINITKEQMDDVDPKTKLIKSLIGGTIIGLICGFVGAGGGIMMLLILTSVLKYELKTAVGTSVLIMTFTALFGATSHFIIGGMPDILCLVVCCISTLVFAQIAAKVANNISNEKLNRFMGILLVVLAFVMITFNYVNM